MTSFNDIFSELKDITNTLLTDEDDYLTLTNAIKRYKEMLLGIATVDLEDESNRLNIHTDQGKALGTTWAVMCLDDLMRTKRFIKGLHEAIVDRRTNGNEPIHLVYAGTGPFAALVLPLITRFSPQELQLTLIELNETSYSLMEQITRTFRMEDYIRDMICDDATKLKLPDPASVDILLSETMQHALRREHQVPIVLNLLSQMPENVILIPEKITVEAALMNPSRNMERLMGGDSYIVFYTTFGKIVELSRDSVNEYITRDDDKIIYRFPELALEFPHSAGTEGFNQLCILTTIQVYNDNFLRIYDSGLTMPWILADIDRLPSVPKTLIAQYKLDQEIDITYQLIED